MDCHKELALGRAAFDRRDDLASRLHFGRAHGACHEDKAMHLAAHPGLLKLALRNGNLPETLQQAAFYVLTALFG